MKKEEELREEELSGVEKVEEEEEEEQEEKGDKEEGEEKEDEDNEDEDDEEMSYEEFEEMAPSLLPGIYLGKMEIEGGMSSAFVHTSAEENEDGSYSIYFVPDPFEGCYFEPYCEEAETIEKEDIKKWLKENGLDENALDEREEELSKEEEEVGEDEKGDDEKDDDDDEMTPEEYEELAQSILPGIYLGTMETAGGYWYTSAEKDADGSYDIYIVPYESDDSCEPTYYNFNEIADGEDLNLGKDDIKKWLTEHGFEENALDE
ncbi:MAG: hypothetical protein NTY74_14765 [Ignavibacteriae bacterium]|nr:hypothetical protein [Ignavibacteriota bacterium]